MNLLSIIKTKFFLFFKKLYFVVFTSQLEQVIVQPAEASIFRKVFPFDRLGIAQDISKRYSSKDRKMIPHIHLQMECLDPSCLCYNSFANYNIIF